MKLVVKLNRRHKLYNELRMTHAWRFEDYSKNVKDIHAVESFLKEKYGQQEWGWAYSSIYGSTKKWATHWGKPRRDRPRVYWIGVKDEEMIFVAGLCGVKV
jgi:hypothetical protein